MKSELIVDVQASEVSIALLEDSRLVSLQKEARNIAYAVGDIYLAKIRKIMPGLNAAFVNVGYEKDAFLHYLDLGPHFASYEAYLKQLLGEDRRRVPAIEKMKLLPDIDKHGTVADTLTQGSEMLVQIVKEPISSKGPRLTTEITFTGRFLVLIPFSDKISISQKIKSTEEKMRLRQLIESIKPKNFGVIVRTSAESKRAAELIKELKTLVECWNTTVAKAQKATAPSLIFEEESRIVGMLRDIFSPSFESIQVNDSDTYEQILKYVSLIAPERRDIVQLYKKDEPIFDHFGITRQIKSSFGKTVSFRSGAYIIIESTEALHVVDVNSGNRSKATNDQETNALDVNLRAADEIARQLRLRDMGGIIVVDFIDMAKGEHRQQLYEHMREIMANDRARHNILPLSKFGLMQITRQRVRPALDIVTAEKCPSCYGKGEVQPSLLFTDTLFEKLDYLVNTLNVRGFIMYVHPFVDAYIKRGIFTSLYGKWRRRLGRCFKILADESLAYLQYRVIDSERNEIFLEAEKDLETSSVEKRNKAKKRGSDDRDGLSDLEIAENAMPAVPAAPARAKAAGKPAEAPAPAPAPAPVADNAADTTAGNDTDATPSPAPEADRPKPRRRRRKKSAAAADTEAANADIAGDTDAAERPDTPADSAATPDSDTADSAADTSDAAAAPKPRKPRRRRNKNGNNAEAAAADGSATDNAGTDNAGTADAERPRKKTADKPAEASDSPSDSIGTQSPARQLPEHPLPPQLPAPADLQ